jgi:hypothetical protein
MCAGGVRWYQDSDDRSSTANLKAHAIHCFGAAAVKAATTRKDTVSVGSFFGRALVVHKPHICTDIDVWLVDFNHLFQLSILMLCL